ncbi:MAG: peptide deformylase [Bacteroidetes bacterium]|nr:peptide deformylase [Bacteroidota bacterium]MDA1119144.1 peptide deformylase [Bacteroidota bacterium]
MIYPILLYGDPVLKVKAKEVEKGTIDLFKLSEDLFETMKSASGIGLAAPQIGKSLKIFVVDTSHLQDEAVNEFKQVFVNPKILEETGRPWGFEEGCLSIPGIREMINRNEVLRIKYYDENWEPHEDTFDGMIARIIQHEYDHIMGTLFTDYLTPLKKRLLKGKLGNISKGKVDVDYIVKAPVKK